MNTTTHNSSDVEHIKKEEVEEEEEEEEGFPLTRTLKEQLKETLDTYFLIFFNFQGQDTLDVLTQSLTVLLGLVLVSSNPTTFPQPLIHLGMVYIIFFALDTTTVCSLAKWENYWW